MFSAADAAGGNERGRLRPGSRPPGLGAAAGAAGGDVALTGRLVAGFDPADGD